MLNTMRPFQIAALILCTGLSNASAKEALEYTLNHQRIRIKNNTKSDERLLTLSEAFGHFIGRNLNNPGIEFDLERFIKGIRAGAQGKPAPLSDEEYEELMALYQEKAFKDLSDNNLLDAIVFLENNLGNEGVIELDNGKLQYEVLQGGEGEAVMPDSAPLIHFTGKLMDGTVFGTTEGSGGPAVIPLVQTVKGFQKGIIGMREGEKRRLYIHPDYGYGDSGNLPPNTLLIFDIEVVRANNPDVEEEPISYRDDYTITEEEPLKEPEEQNISEGETQDQDAMDLHLSEQEAEQEDEQEDEYQEPGYSEVMDTPASIEPDIDSNDDEYLDTMEAISSEQEDEYSEIENSEMQDENPNDLDHPTISSQPEIHPTTVDGAMHSTSEEMKNETLLDENITDLNEEPIQIDEAEFEELDLLDDDFDMPNW